MKKNLKWLINVAAICLCVCAMAIGIYAAKNASLTATGTIGFTAHDCEVNIGADIVSVITAEGTERTTKSLTATKISGEGEINLNNAFETGTGMYFSDIAENGDTIEITFKLENLSAYDIEVIPGTVTLSSQDITTDWSATTLKLGALEGAAANGSGSDYATLTLKVVLNDIDNVTTFSAAELSVTIDFVKSSPSPYKIESVTPYSEELGTTIVVELGTYPSSYGDLAGQPIRWYAFAKQGTSGTMETLLSNTGKYNLTEVASGTYYFVSEFVFAEYVMFNSDGNNQDYEDSDVRKYLNGNGDNTDTSEFMTAFGITRESLNNIGVTSRTLESEDDCILNCTDDLWLLSVDDLTLLWYQNEIDECVKTTARAKGGGTWWLRSPVSSGQCYCVGDGDYTTNDGDLTIEYCIRAGFKVVIG